MLQNLTVLYVEDEAIIRDTIESVLKGYCSTVITAENGEEGLTLFKQKAPDLVITDIQMPQMDGFAMIRAIQEISPQIPFIVTSAFSDPGDFMHAIRLKVHHYLVKPVNIKEIFGVLDEVAEEIGRRREIENLQRLLAQYKDAVDTSAIVSKTDPRGIITYVNDAFVYLSGYSRNELVGHPHNMVRHPDMPASVFKEMWETIRAKKAWKGIVKNLRKDGSSYTVDATIIPILGAKGEIIEYIGVRHDVTELEEYREILESQLDISLKSMGEKINQIKQIEKAVDAATAYTRNTLEGKMSYVNDRFLERLGYKKEELLGRDHELIVWFDPGQREMIEETVGQKQECRMMIKYRTRGGETRYFDSVFVPILDVEEKIVEVMGIHHDITDIITLSHEIEATQKEVVVTMGAIGETRSKETGDHVKRVAEYSRFLAVKSGMDPKEAELLKMASPMHDIGKVGIPDAILNKPGKLTDEEYEHMKEHAALGYEMLKSSNREILKAAATVAHEHHEKWDGSGYPRGLAGEDIHIYGRITAIADVFDALGHDRVYKKAWELERILALLKAERGRHFDPNLIDIFMENLDEVMAIKEHFDKL